MRIDENARNVKCADWRNEKKKLLRVFKIKRLQSQDLRQLD